MATLTATVTDAQGNATQGNADLTVQQPGTLWPNEPANYTLLDDQEFNTKVWTDPANTGWARGSAPIDPAVMRIVQLPDTGQASPPNAYETFFAKGMEGGRGPGGCHARNHVDGKTSLYVGAYVMFAANWDCHRSGSNKMFHIVFNNRERMILQWRGCNQIMSSDPGSLLRPNVNADFVDMFGKWAKLEWLVVFLTQHGERVKGPPARVLF